MSTIIPLESVEEATMAKALKKIVTTIQSRLLIGPDKAPKKYWYRYPISSAHVTFFRSVRNFSATLGTAPETVVNINLRIPLWILLHFIGNCSMFPTCSWGPKSMFSCKHGCNRDLSPNFILKRIYCNFRVSFGEIKFKNFPRRIRNFGKSFFSQIVFKICIVEFPICR